MFRFLDHTFDPDTGELDGPRESLRLPPKPGRLLAMLLEAGGELVERDAIRDALWPDTTVDFEAGLNTCVRQIRTALRETGGEAKLIETLPKRGYRFAVAVRRDGPSVQPIPSVVVHDTRLTSAAALPYVVVFVLLAIGASLVIWNELFGSGAGDRNAAGNDAATESAPASAPARLAVLPFVDPDAGEPTPYNSRLTDAFVAALVDAAPNDIVVVGPTTTAPPATPGATPAAIAAAVNADFVLHGGYGAGAGALFVQVVTPDGGHVFARRFEDWDTAASSALPELVEAMVAAIRAAGGG